MISYCLLYDSLQVFFVRTDSHSRSLLERRLNGRSMLSACGENFGGTPSYTAPQNIQQFKQAGEMRACFRFVKRIDDEKTHRKL